MVNCEWTNTKEEYSPLTQEFCDRQKGMKVLSVFTSSLWVLCIVKAGNWPKIMGIPPPVAVGG